MIVVNNGDKIFDTLNQDISGGSTKTASNSSELSPVRTGSLIGSSKEESLFEKISSTSLRSVGYGDSKPLVTKGLPEAKGSNKNSWFDLEVKYPVQARLDDVERISKLLTKLQGIKWEGHTAALETIQNNLEASRINPAKSTMAARSNNDVGYWQKLEPRIEETLKSAGIALVSAEGMTTSTLTQVATSGLGEHQEPFLGRSYLREGEVKSGPGFDILNSLISSLGLGGLGNISGANKAQAGVEIRGHAAYGLVNEGDLANPYGEGSSRVQPSRYSQAGIVDDSSNKYGIHYHDKDHPYVPGKDQPLPESSSLYLTEPKLQNIDPKKIVQRRTENAETYEDHKFSGSRGSITWSRKSDYSGEESYTSDLSSGSVVHVNSRKSEKPTDGTVRAFTILSTESKDYADYTQLKSLGAEDDAEDAFQSQFNLIPFEIQSIMPTEKYVLHFQANLDSYDDSFSADWNAASYVGRADKFYTYGGFTRDINFSFKAVALQEKHLHPIYNQLNLLAANTTPTYGDGIFMKGTLARITIGELLNRQYGFIKSVKMSWDTEVPWETLNFRVPHMLSVSVSFTPLHNFNPVANKISYFGID